MKSGIEMIENLCRKVELLNKRFEIIEQNTKELLNRANGFTKPVPQQDVSKPSIASTAPVPQIAEEQPKEQKAPNSIKVMGKIKNKEGKSVSGVNVKIFNSNNQVVKETKTNRAGDWMCFLPPGKYGAEYFLENVIQANVGFNISPEQKLLRVAQPQL
jgi:hypothetical protein